MFELMKRNKKKILAILIMLLIILLLALFSRKLIHVLKDVDGLKRWLNRFGVWQYLIFILLVSIQVVVAVIPGGVYQVAGGFVYGTVLGSILCMIGCAVGSIIVFLMVKKFGMRVIRIFVSEESVEKTRFITDSPKCSLLLSVCFIIPGAPKDVISYIAGLTNISFWQWVLICSIGRLPGILLSGFVGNAFSSNNYSHAIAACLLLAFICLIGAWGYKKIAEKRNSKEE